MASKQKADAQTEFRDLAVNLVFLGLTVFLQTFILPSLVVAAEQDQVNWLLVALVVGAQFLKNIALWLRYPQLKQFSHSPSNQSLSSRQSSQSKSSAGVTAVKLSYLGGVIVLLLPLLHIGVNVFMLTSVLRPVVTADSFVWYQPLVIIGWITLMLIDMLATVFTFGKATSANPITTDQQPFFTRLHPGDSGLSQLAADLFLAIYAAVGVVYAWDFLVATTPMEMNFLDLSGAALFYLMVYAATRWLSVLEFWQADQTSSERGLASITFLTSLFLVIKSAL